MGGARVDSWGSVVRSAAHFFSGTFLSRLSGGIRDMAMAYAFGVEPALALFLLSFRLSHLFRRIFGEGPFQSAFIPEFETLRHVSQERAFGFFCALRWVLSLALAGLIAFLMGGCSLALKWVEGDWRRVLELTFWMLPSLWFICLFGLNAGLLQCEKNYFLPSVAPVAFNAFWIAAVVWIGWMQPQDPMQTLALGVILACAAQWALTLPAVHDLIKKGLGTAPWWYGMRGCELDLWGLVRGVSFGVVGVASSQMNQLLDVLFAKWADPSGPAVLWFAARLEQLPVALFGVALAGSLLPPLSRTLRSGQMEQYHFFLGRALKVVVVLFIPLTGFVLVFGKEVVTLVYARGHFQTEAVLGTTLCLWGYVVGLVPAVAVLVLAPALYAKKQYHTPALLSSGAVLMNVGLNTFFVYQMGWGTFSVALATSIAAWAHLVCLVMVLKRERLFIWPTELKGFLRDVLCGTGLFCGFLLLYKTLLIQA